MRQKSRPDDNSHCFEGAGYAFWQAIAMGFQPTGFSKRPDGYSLDLKDDLDGFAVQNGGMLSPKVVKLPPHRAYFRFFGTIRHNTAGPLAAMSGGWWLENSEFTLVYREAKRLDIPLSQAAQRLLVIPKEWHDCGYVAAAILKRPMKAFRGEGLPAAGGISVASGLRDPQVSPATIGAPHLHLKQLFVPGPSSLIAGVFERVWIKQVIRTGVRLFPDD